MVDAPDLGSGAERRGGSSPLRGTNMKRLCDNLEFVWYENGYGEVYQLNKIKGWPANAQHKEAFKRLEAVFAPAKGQLRNGMWRERHVDDDWRPAKKNDPPYWIDLFMDVWEMDD